jgi:predicted dinucleotide-binding enzyme
MRIGIIGSGRIGGTLAGHFVRAGHEVAVSNSRGPETLQDFVAELGENARATTPHEAAQFGDLVVVAVPFGRYRELPTEGLGKVVIDTNNYYPERDGPFTELGDQIGFDAVDAGTLAEGGRKQQPGTNAYLHDFAAGDLRGALTA